MVESALRERVLKLERRPGRERRRLRLGPVAFCLDGLAPETAERLATRWGPFLDAQAPELGAIEVLFRLDDGPAWFEAPRAGEVYRVEVRGSSGDRVVVSYQFAITQDRSRNDRWWVALRDAGVEPFERTIENVMRYLTGRVALDHGGFAMHGAAVLHDGRAFVVAGPSGAGKTTAVASMAPARSLGDDFTLVVCDGSGDGTRWLVPAVPFDNSERVAADAEVGTYPLAGIWRLYQADRFHVERPPAPLAIASLLHCAAFPWALPEQADALLRHVRELIGDRRFAHLHFARDSDLWAELLRDFSGYA